MVQAMFLNEYHNNKAGLISITRQQASDFAKKIAGDFNPIHDADAKRFCVPGDLLFSLVLNRYGLSQHMHFNFAGMVGDEVPLNFPETDENRIDITDANGKLYLSVERSGARSTDHVLIENLTKNYVAFSGQTFPHILVPLMAKNEVMINPDRPMVIYQSMIINISDLNINAPTLELADSVLDVDGKRGNVRLSFRLMADGTEVGTGEKSMVLSGLKTFEQSSIDSLVNDYSARKHTYSV